MPGSAEKHWVLIVSALKVRLAYSPPRYPNSAKLPVHR
ncbi:hypothetical protein ATK74_2744 [Propionicimonas paludicola]|uniref:Uncharacterized protein n=1 Tax=Propionicimonas paludicola TaxID=185243 RepID=A0A2A9CUQ0_9ACTN|nr:hypothetical protein ATK74_2744 [Propionicimonas paludicola]